MPHAPCPMPHAYMQASYLEFPVARQQHPLKCMPHEIHAYKVHAYKIHAYEMHAHETHICDVLAYVDPEGIEVRRKRSSRIIYSPMKALEALRARWGHQRVIDPSGG
jgi:hypothetical protein